YPKGLFCYWTKEKRLNGVGDKRESPPSFSVPILPSTSVINNNKGRSRENLKSYTKDRRAYEYWSDGNIHAANMFMGSSFFNGSSADHIGPISLGFIHDPRYLRRMTSSDNFTKRDRLQVEDVKEIITVEQTTGICSISWYSAMVWEHIKNNYSAYPELVGTRYRDILKQNMANFMFILMHILENTSGEGEKFLLQTLIEPKYEFFLHTYKFDELGQIIKETPRHFTERINNEIERFKRIAFESVFDYNSKSESESKRHAAPDLISVELSVLDNLCHEIQQGEPFFKSAFRSLQSLMVFIQKRLLI
nr:hypothetical protein [Clostridia bacterium]